MTKRAHFQPMTTPKQEKLSVAGAPKPTRNDYLHGKTGTFHLQKRMFLPFCQVRKFYKICVVLLGNVISMLFLVFPVDLNVLFSRSFSHMLKFNFCSMYVCPRISIKRNIFVNVR